MNIHKFVLNFAFIATALLGFTMIDAQSIALAASCVDHPDGCYDMPNNPNPNLYCRECKVKDTSTNTSYTSTACRRANSTTPSVGDLDKEAKRKAMRRCNMSMMDDATVDHHGPVDYDLRGDRP